ncbi:MAG: GNAT family N-acetyltransferase [Xanthobacteraceae bacterium]|nr:GNAT family N-acetyltransferase [Xanthobacteraceae bacterium]
MSDLADLAPKSRTCASPPHAVAAAGRGADEATPVLSALEDVDAEAWHALADRAAEPNGYYLPGWERAVNACAPGRGGALALTVWDPVAAPPAPRRLIALLPATSAWRAFRIPVAALVSADPYGVLGTPLLDAADSDAAAHALLVQARAAGLHALVLRDVALDGPALAALTRSLGTDGLAPRLVRRYARAGLDAMQDAEALLRDALGAKKLKELRRQRHRLAEHGAVAFAVARDPDEVARALEVFFTLEASGWKARRGTAMAQSPGDAAFLRRASADLSVRGACEIVTLSAGATPVAAGVVLRHLDRAFWFKLGIDQRFAKFSPGVQLALELTRHLCADPRIRFADSTASPDHPMINPIWRQRLALGDVLLPLRRHDPAVELLHLALLARRYGRDAARGIVHALRRWARRA